MSLNKEADLIANTLDQPFNHELKERIKDIFKQEIALIINKLANRGIDEQLTLHFEPEVIAIDEYVDKVNKKGYKGKVIRTKYKVPTTIRIRKDAPYLQVGSIDGKITYPYRHPGESSAISLFSSTGESYSYYTANGYIYINNNSDFKFKGKYILIKDIFENPEEVLSMYEDIDGQDLELPISNDIKAMIRDKILNILSQIKIDNPDIKTEEQ